MRYGPNSSSEKLTTLVADIVCQSLQIEETPIPRKIARLYLVSDILPQLCECLRDGPVTCANLNRHRQWQTFGDIARCLRVDCLRPLPTLPLSIRDSWNWWGLLPRMSSKSRSTQFSQFGKDGALASNWGPRTDNSHRMVFTADFHKILRDLLHGQATLESLLLPQPPSPSRNRTTRADPNPLVSSRRSNALRLFLPTCHRHHQLKALLRAQAPTRYCFQRRHCRLRRGRDGERRKCGLTQGTLMGRTLMGRTSTATP
jgi:hypothetical protein